MINQIINKLNGKNIVILGFGKEGKSTYRFIRKYMGNIKLTIADKNDVRNSDELTNDNNVDVIFGNEYLNNLDKFDLIIKSPGISLNYLDSKYLYSIQDNISVRTFARS